MTRRPSGQHDQVAILKRSRRLVTGFGAIVTLGAGAWACWPISSVDDNSLAFVPPPVDDTTNEESADFPMPRLDPDAFRTARLWNPPPEPVQAEKQKEVIVRRPELELIGIIEEDGRYLAALYDLDQNEMRIVASGDRIEPFQVAAITAEEVRLEDGRHVALLAIRSEERPR